MTPLDNDAAAFWQSRMTTANRRADYPDLIDLSEGARRMRDSYPQGVDRIALHTILAPLATRMALTAATSPEIHA